MVISEKKYFWHSIIIILIVLAGIYLWFFKADKVVAPEDLGGVQNEMPSEDISFIDQTGAVSLKYDKNFKVSSMAGIPTKEWRMNSGDEGIILVRVDVQKDFMPMTNFGGAKLIIGRATSFSAISSCIAPGENIGEEDVETVLMGELPFHKFVSSDGGAGNFYEMTSYRGILDGDCYSIEYSIHYSNLGAYAPEDGIKEFNKTNLQNKLEEIVKSVEFLVSSD